MRSGKTVVLINNIFFGLFANVHTYFDAMIPLNDTPIR